MSGRTLAITIFVVTLVALGLFQWWPDIANLLQPPPRLPLPEPPRIPRSEVPLPRLEPAGPNYEFIVRAIVSGVLSAAALFVILTKRYEPSDKNWAYGTLGTIAGFWLRG